MATIHLEGHLVPAGLLVDGYLIRQERPQSITDWHVELPQHDVILAEAAPCESYLDVGNRADFGETATTLHPSFATMDEIWRTHACAPQCRGGPLLAHLRGNIARPAPPAIAAA